MNDKQIKLIEKIIDYDFITEKGDYENHATDEHIKLVYSGNKVKDIDNIYLSIIIPTINRPDLLKETIESIIKQEYDKEYEIVVLDNEGLDYSVHSKTEEVILSFDNSRIMYYRNDKCIPSADNWNTLLYLARGKLVCMIHDDDVFIDNALSIMSNLIDRDKKICFLGCINKSFNISNPIVNPRTSKNVKKVDYTEFMYGMPISLLGAFFEKDKALEIGGFEARSYMQDYSFISQYAYYYGTYLLEAELYGYRISELQDSANNEMNFVRRVADYYLWRSIAKKRKCKKFFLKNCEYNIKNRIEEYNRSTNYKNSHIDLDEMLNVCNINRKNMCNIEYIFMKFVHGLVFFKNKIMN